MLRMIGEQPSSKHVWISQSGAFAAKRTQLCVDDSAEVKKGGS